MKVLRKDTLSAAHLRQVEQEYHILASTAHSFLVPLLYSCQNARAVCFVMECRA